MQPGSCSSLVHRNEEAWEPTPSRKIIVLVEGVLALERQRGLRDEWRAGVRYEGEWKDGVEHGVGTLIEVDGSTFYGFWAGGKMHGEGVRLPCRMTLLLCLFIFFGS